MKESALYRNSLATLVDDLAHLASLKIQERYVVNGTPESYLTPDDLLENLDSSLLFFRFEKAPERINKLERSLGCSAFQKLLALERLVKDNPSFLDCYTFESLATLVHDDPVWVRIRSIASEVLREMNFDLQEWEKEYA